MHEGWDTVAWFITITHALIGHDKTAALIHMPPEAKEDCVICQYEADPTHDNKERVYRHLAKPT